jgi:phospho-N-acetylmuramoyl-pentapeptide-transferase
MNTVVAMVLAALIAFTVSALSGKVIVPWLRKLHFGQNIYEGFDEQQKKKQGTPTMGGIMFIFAFYIAVAVVLLIDKLTGGDIVSHGSFIPSMTKVKFYSCLLLPFAFALVGFADDWLKIKKGTNEGLTDLQKTICEVLVSAAYLATLTLSHNGFIFLPFAGTKEYFSVIFFWIFGLLVIYGTVNSVNFADGVDGLCASTAIASAAAFALMAVCRQYLGISMAACAIIGALFGYLIWNWHPAKCFMGDTGALFLGGLLAAFAFSVDCPLIILLAGIIYVFEALTVVAQRVYFKLSHGKRLPMITPYHHELQKRGWKEEKIVGVFTLINAVGGACAVLLFWFGR